MARSAEWWCVWGRSACGAAVMAWSTVAGAVSIDLQPAGAAAGGQTIVYGVLDTMGAEVSGVQLDMTPAPGLSIPANERGRPACRHLCREGFPRWPLDEAGAADPAGGAAKICSFEGFAFQPPGCEPEIDCTGVRYLEISLDSSDRLPDGGTLFECLVQIDPDAVPGSSLGIACRADASNPNGVRIPSTCSAGIVGVLCPGDCDADGSVTVAEVVLGFGIAHGETPLSDCMAMDADASGSVQIGDLVQARRSVLGACGQ